MDEKNALQRKTAFQIQGITAQEMDQRICFCGSTGKVIGVEVLVEFVIVGSLSREWNMHRDRGDQRPADTTVAMLDLWSFNRFNHPNNMSNLL